MAQKINAPLYILMTSVTLSVLLW